MSNTNQLMKRFLEAAQEVLQDGLKRAADEDPMKAIGLVKDLADGGLLRIHATASLAGLAFVGVQVIKANGATQDIAQVELKRGPLEWERCE
ncbi:hypothetical protein [Rubrivivax gelatinosus]|uniref:hypothetical protein n=1 Tax=Rubrivivax gelatinosus TaxID=28068 RepID=UPI0002D28A71|nr:hypothetical protein [Rubrivivax gelatinosus]MBG6082713.1 hypothetical protein [Rubrivivax gelatinosus]